MPKKFNKVLIGYVNKYKTKDGHYLSIKNVSQEPVVIEPGESLLMQRTPDDIKQKYPKVPHFSKSEVVEALDDKEVKKINDEIPF
jgi:hypothetical protein